MSTDAQSTVIEDFKRFREEVWNYQPPKICGISAEFVGLLTKQLWDWAVSCEPPIFKRTWEQDGILIGELDMAEYCRRCEANGELAIGQFAFLAYDTMPLTQRLRTGYGASE